MKKDILITVDSGTSEIYLNNGTLGVSNENLQSNIVFSFINGFVDGTALLEVNYGYTHHYSYICTGNESGTYKFNDKVFTMPTVVQGDEIFYITTDNLYLNHSGTTTEITLTTGTSSNELTFTGRTSGYYLMTKDDETYTLPIKSSLLLKKGQINLQLRITQTGTGTPVFKSNIFYLTVRDSLNTTNEIPDFYPSLIDIINNKLTKDNIIAGANITLDKVGNNITINSTGGSGGTSDYTQLSNKPKINNVELTGNKSLSDLGINIPTKTSDLTNDSGYITNAYHDSTKQDKITSSTDLSAKSLTTTGNLTVNGDETNINGKLFVKTGAVEMTGGTVTIGSTNIGYAQAENLYYRENGSTEPAEYTNVKTAIDTLKSGKQDIIQYSTMPTASSAYNGKIVEYIGTTGTYTNGYFYQCGETTEYTPASLSITTSGTSGLGTVTGNADTFGDAVYDNEEDAYTFEYRAYPDNITVVTASDGNKTLMRNRVGDTNGRYAWLMTDNSTVYTETQNPELGTEFYSTATEDSAEFVSYDDVTVNEYSDTYGRWQLDYGDDMYEDVDLSEYGISYNGVALIGAKITVQYIDEVENSNEYTWTQKNVQPTSGGSSDFDQLTNRPKYNGTLMTSSTDIPEVPTKTSDLTNDSNFVTNTDYATTSTAGVIKVNSGYAIGIYLGNLYADKKTYEQYSSAGDNIFVSKGTLENVITGKHLDNPAIATTVPATLELNTVYDLGEQTTLSLTLPTGSVGKFIEVQFISGSTPTTLTISSTSGLSETDISPEANTIYSIFFEWLKLDSSTYGWGISYIDYVKSNV